MTRRLAMLAWAMIAAFHGAPSFAAACADPGGIGGTGITSDGGIGGTGARADADVGLIGVITGFGSICVNGIEVHYEPATPVTLNGNAVPSSVLALGQTVAVRAVGRGSEARAQAIHIFDAAVGPIASVGGRGELQVSGQRVRIEPSTVLGPGLSREDLAKAAGVERLRVSGLRTADGTIVATRVERAPPEADAGPPGGRAAVLESGRFIVQGYVAELRSGAEVRMDGTAFSVQPQIAGQLARDRLVRLHGRTERDGRHVVERAEVLRTPLDARPERVIHGGAERRDIRDRGSERSGDRGDRDRSGRNERPERPDRSGRH